MAKSRLTPIVSAAVGRPRDMVGRLLGERVDTSPPRTG